MSLPITTTAAAVEVQNIQHQLNPMRRYLNAEERLSQVWLNHHLLMMAILVVKVFLFSKTLAAALAANQKTANSLCTKLNRVLSQVLEVPQQVATISQIILESALETSEQMIKKMLSLCITIAKAMVEFALEIYLGTIGCLCTAFVKGCLDLLTDALEAVTEFVQSVINAVIEAFDSALSGLSTIINGIIKVVDEVKTFFEGTDTSGVLKAVEKVNMTVASLTSITIPTTYIEELSNLTNNIPDFEDVLSDLALIITEPLTSFSYNIGNSSMTTNLTLPDMQSTSYNVLNDTCTNIDHSFEEAIRSTLTMTNFILIGLGGATVILLVLIFWLEHRKWNRHEALLRLLSMERLVITIGNTLHDYDHRILTKFTKNAGSSWQLFATYISTPTLTKCLSIGIAGIIAVGLQYCILSSMDKKMKNILKVAVNLTAASYLAQNETTTFLNDTQFQLTSLLKEINEELFSSIESTTLEMYLGVVAASSTINNTINSIFGSTPFALPLETIIYCTIGRKLDDIEYGLHWILNNTEVKFPVLPRAQLQAYSNQAVIKIANLTSNVSGEVYDGIRVLVLMYKEVLKIELITSCAFLGLWVVAACIGGIFMIMTPAEGDVKQPIIAYPRPMSETEKFQYAFPFTDPFSLPGITGSSRYTDT